MLKMCHKILNIITELEVKEKHLPKGDGDETKFHSFFIFLVVLLAFLVHL